MSLKCVYNVALFLLLGDTEDKSRTTSRNATGAAKLFESAPTSTEINNERLGGSSICQDSPSTSNCGYIGENLRYKYRNHIVYCLENYNITILATEVGVNDLKLPQVFLSFPSNFYIIYLSFSFSLYHTEYCPIVGC